LLAHLALIGQPTGLKSTLLPLPAGKLDGFEYLDPKPEDHGYTVTYGLVSPTIAISFPSRLKAILNPLPDGNVDGFEYLDPKPDDQG